MQFIKSYAKSLRDKQTGHVSRNRINLFKRVYRARENMCIYPAKIQSNSMSKGEAAWKVSAAKRQSTCVGVTARLRSM